VVLGPNRTHLAIEFALLVNIFPVVPAIVALLEHIIVTMIILKVLVRLVRMDTLQVVLDPPLLGRVIKAIHLLETPRRVLV
jgi:hypothetical protein